MRISLITLTLSLVVLTGCADPYPPTPKPDYTIRVIPNPNGTLTAVPPTCPSWSTAVTDPYDNQALPQLGCASARNLAMMVEQPQDLVQGRTMGDASGVTAVGSVLRYNNNQTRGLIWTGNDPNTVAVTTAGTAASTITGEANPPGASSGSTASSAAGSSSSASPIVP